MRIGIVADSGQPADLVSGILNELEDDGKLDGVEVESVTGTLPMTEDGQVELDRYGPSVREARAWDKMIYVTDLPVTAANRPVVSRPSTNGRDVLLSTPAYGGFGARHRLRRELSSLLAGDGPVYGVERTERTDGTVSDGDGDGGGAGDGGGDGDKNTAPVTVRVLDNAGRNLRLVGGMVRANQPGSLLPVMTGSLAAMAATGGFGVFYGSIWNLSEAMGAWRLGLLSIMAVITLAAWLIVRNRLWIRRGTQQSRWRENIDNTVTVLTIALTVLLMFILAAVGMTLLSMLVVPPDYLASELEEGPSWDSYLRIGWLSAVLGTFAGAIGSNFDRSVEIRSATYTVREYERRRAVGDRIEEAEREGSLRDAEFVQQVKLWDDD